jgi:opacity protein-like surface antigen
LLVAVVLFGGVAQGQTDLAASVYGAFTAKVNGNGVTQSPANGAGAMVEFHHQANPLVGYVVTYSWNRADQRYSESGTTCGLQCSPSEFAQGVKANAQEATAAWEVGVKVLNLRPFLLAGGGILFNQAAQNPSSTTTTNRNHTAGVLVYGGGVDVGLLPHVGVRAQYRGNVYSAPQLSTAFSSTKAFFTTSEPMLGVYVRF